MTSTPCTKTLFIFFLFVYVVCIPLKQQGMSNYTALRVAVERNHADVVEVLIDAGADIETDTFGRSPLHMACSYGQLTTMRKLVKAGADLRATDNRRNTCLILAALHGHTDTVRYLVCLPEVDLNHQDMSNYTALHVAVERNRADVVEVLIDAGADIEMKCLKGGSPLHMACISGELRTVRKLVEAGADVRTTDDEGNTCLIFAAYNGHTDTVRYLVGLPEVDLNHEDSKNFTALHYAA